MDETILFCFVFLSQVLLISWFYPRRVIASLFCQGVALAMQWPSYSYRVDKVDFDVYRQDAQDSTPDASARIGSPWTRLAAGLPGFG